MPDAYQSIRNRPDYAICFANQNVWKSNTGYNLLFSNLQIGGPPVTQPPTNTPLPTKPPTDTPTPTIPSGDIPGDANNDGLVDGQDFIIWLINYGRSTGNGASDGDFNNNSTVNTQDYTIWVKNY